MDGSQLSLFDVADPPLLVLELLNTLLIEKRRPSAYELVKEIRRTLGESTCVFVKCAVSGLSYHPNLSRADRDYFCALIESGELDKALQRPAEPDEKLVSEIDLLLHQSRRYRTSDAFREMIDFMGRFRLYAPYNNMLVRLQNPACGFFATARDWNTRFGRALKEDARPMLILAPMHPVMLVYDLDQTEGEEVPQELLKFAQFEGEWKTEWLERTLENAKRHRIKVDFKTLSSTLGGFATLGRESGDWKMRVAVHDGLDQRSRFGVLSHELAHIFLGHLGSDWDRWWPARASLDRSAMEVEAEAAAFITTSRLGLKGSSAAYVSRYLTSGDIPPGLSVDTVAKVAGLIERMAREMVPAPKPRPLPKVKPKKAGRQ